MSENIKTPVAIYVLIVTIAGLGVFNAYSIYQLNERLQDSGLQASLVAQANKSSDAVPVVEKEVKLAAQGTANNASLATDNENGFDQEEYDRLNAEKLEQEKAELKAKAELEVAEKDSFEKEYRNDAAEVEAILSKIEELTGSNVQGD